MGELKACGIVLCALIVCIVFKNLKSDYSLLVRIVVTVSVFSVSLSLIYPVLSYIEKISSNSEIYKYMPTLMKALGVAFVVEITADICNDAQESTLADRITFLGKAEILVLSLPLLKSLFELSEGLLK